MPHAWAPTYVDLDLGARAAGVGGAGGLVGGVDPHPAHAAGELVARVEQTVVGLLHNKLGLGQPHTCEAGGEVVAGAAARASRADDHHRGDHHKYTTEDGASHEVAHARTDALQMT